MSVGTALMEHVHKLAKVRQSKLSTVYTTNFQAEAFYNKLGFRSECVRNYYANDTSVIVLFKYLAKL